MVSNARARARFEIAIDGTPHEGIVLRCDLDTGEQLGDAFEEAPAIVPVQRRGRPRWRPGQP